MAKPQAFLSDDPGLRTKADLRRRLSLGGDDLPELSLLVIVHNGVPVVHNGVQVIHSGG